MAAKQIVEILLVDKHSDRAARLNYLLAEANSYHYRITQTDSLSQCFDLLLNSQPDLVLLDFNFSESYKFETLTKIKAVSPGTPVIILNGFSNQSLSREAILLGAHDYLVQGEENNPKLLNRVMRYVVEHRHVQSALQYRFEFEKLIATISTQFISLKVDEIDNSMEAALRKIGEFAEVDRGYIFWYSDKFGRHMKRIHEWCAEGIAPQLDRIRELSMGMFPYFDQKIKNLEPFHAPRVADLPAEACSERSEFGAQGVQSLIFVPMIYTGEAVGFVGFESVRSEKVWTEDTISLLKMVSEIFINAFERKRADETLRESEERYALAARGVNDGLWDWNIKTNRIYFSARWKAMLGYRDDEIGENPNEWFRRIHPDDRDHVQSKITLHIEGLSDYYESEHRMRHKDGGYRWMLCRGIVIKDAKGRPYRMAGSQTDITDRKRAEEQLIHNALHDNLTNLPSRTLFLNRLEHAFDRSQNHPDYHFSVLFLDLDGFKAVNDSFGHLVGDQLLIEVARRLERCVEPSDTVARFGGDEFTILLEDVEDAAEAIRMAEMIEKELQLPFYLKEQTMIISASIGIAMSSPDMLKAEDLLRNADTAMYRAKASKKGRHVVFNESMHARVVEMLKIETDLKQASGEKDFEIHYQPIVHLESGRITGFEALLRWKHPERGFISPDVFIPIAEETGLIIPIGLWVMREACLQMKRWKQYFRWDRPMTLSVNLSMKQFMQPDLVEQIQVILDETGFAAGDLKLEITESVFMENTEFVVSTLRRFQAMNIQLLLDDFGTGYSSLSYLHRFKVNALKIDKSFVGNLGPAGENSEIVRAIMLLARNLGIDVIAEGVENEVQREQLCLFGCEFGQGYLFAKPLSDDAVRQLIKESV